MKNITIAEINDLIRDGIKLSSTHNRLCLPVINRIYKKMRAGIKFADIKVSGNMICDGHHRYIASLLVDMPIDCCPPQTTSATEM